MESFSLKLHVVCLNIQVKTFVVTVIFTEIIIVTTNLVMHCIYILSVTIESLQPQQSLVSCIVPTRYVSNAQVAQRMRR